MEGKQHACQHSTAQHSTAQHSTAQHSTAQIKKYLNFIFFYSHALSNHPIRLSLVLLMGLSLPLTGSAALKSAMTKATIVGTAPYFTFDGGVTKAKNLDPLLDLTLSDGTKYSKATNQSTADNPIFLPKSGQSINDVQLYIPQNQSSLTDTPLKEMVIANQFWKDDEGDGKDGEELTINGTLKVTVTDATSKVVTRDTLLDPCFGPYSVQLASTINSLATEYGSPQRSNWYSNTSTLYYIMPPKTAVTAACWANSGDYRIGDGASSNNVWNKAKGFIPQDLNNPSANFPTTGSDKVFFNLTVFPNAAALSYTKSPADSVIDLHISSVSSNSLFSVFKVMLIGPDVSTAKTRNFVPTTFSITYENRSVYTFKVAKWFVGDRTKGPYNINYCSSKYGADYRIPHMNDLENVAWNADHSDVITLDGTQLRMIGGGFFSEWGRFDRDYPDSSLSGIGGVIVWSSDSYTDSSGKIKQFSASSFVALDKHKYDNNNYLSFLCVTP